METTTTVDLNAVEIVEVTGRCHAVANLVQSMLLDVFGVEGAVAMHTARLVQSEQARIQNAVELKVKVGNATKKGETTSSYSGKTKESTTWTQQLVHVCQLVDGASDKGLVIDAAHFAPIIAGPLAVIRAKLISGEIKMA